MKRLILLPLLFAVSVCYGATGSASDGEVFILVVILVLLTPLAIDFLVKIVREKISQFIIHQKRCR